MYKNVHAGAKTHSGGVRGGCISILYQFEPNMLKLSCTSLQKALHKRVIAKIIFRSFILFTKGVSMNIQKITLNDVNFGNKGINKIKAPCNKTRETINAELRKKVDYVRDRVIDEEFMIGDVLENIYVKGIELIENVRIKI